MHSAVRFSRQGRGLALEQTLKGHVYRKTIHGSIRTTMYYKNEHGYQRHSRTFASSSSWNNLDMAALFRQVGAV